MEILADPELNPANVTLDPRQRLELLSRVQPLDHEITQARIHADLIRMDALRCAVSEGRYAVVPHEPGTDLGPVIDAYHERHEGPDVDFNLHLLPDSTPNRVRVITLDRTRHGDYHRANETLDLLQHERERAIRTFLGAR